MKTEICERLGIEFPIFAFSHCRDVVAAVSRAGGLGVLGAVAYSPEQLELELKWIDEHVDGKPYGVDTVIPAKYIGRDQGDIDKTQLEALVGDGDLRDLVNEAREVHEADVSWIGTVGLEDQTYLATDLRGAAPGALDGVVVPRPLSQCQHVVASGEARTSMVATSPDVFAMAGPEVAAAAEAGHAGVARFLETTGAAMDPATAADARPRPWA